jgi:hypothetical protein
MEVGRRARLSVRTKQASWLDDNDRFLPQAPTALCNLLRLKLVRRNRALLERLLTEKSMNRAWGAIHRKLRNLGFDWIKQRDLFRRLWIEIDLALLRNRNPRAGRVADRQRGKRRARRFAVHLAYWFDKQLRLDGEKDRSLMPGVVAAITRVAYSDSAIDKEFMKDALRQATKAA